MRVALLPMLTCGRLSAIEGLREYPHVRGQTRRNLMNVEPYPKDVACCGPDAPACEQIDDLIRLLVTIRERFGNTAIKYRLQWGGSALWADDEQKKLIRDLWEYATGEKWGTLTSEECSNESLQALCKRAEKILGTN
jgi:hypothetical protein